MLPVSALVYLLYKVTVYLPEAPLVGRLRVEHVIGLHHALPAAAELGRFRVEHAFARAIDRGEFVHV